MDIVISEADMAWQDAFELPPRFSNAKPGEKERFVTNGTQIFMALEDAIKTHRPRKKIANMDILDLGCGVGRVAMPFFHKYQRPNAAVDRQRFAVDFMNKVLPGANSQRGTISPPLSYSDESFDVVYAVSMWNHMPQEQGETWLNEVKRLLRPGGLALISTSGAGKLDLLHKHRQRSTLWKNVTAEDLREQGHLFRSRGENESSEELGDIVYDTGWLRDNWSRIMPVVEQRAGAIGAPPVYRQDLQVMKKAD